MQHSEEVIGVIGGLGNEAMVDLGRKIEVLSGSGEASYVFFGNSRLAYKPEEVAQDWGPEDEPELRKLATAVYTARLLQFLGCGRVGLACNSAHELFRRVFENIPLTFVDMLVETASSMREVESKVLVMGVTSLVESSLYQDALAEVGVSGVKSSPENQQKIMSAIYDTSFGIKTAKITEQAENLLCEVINSECEGQGCRKVVLGCTELPLALTDESVQRFKDEGKLSEYVEVIDASSILASALLSASGKCGALSEPLDSYLTEETDWFAPMTFHVCGLSEMVDIQEEVFGITADFLSKRGRSIEGSYLHLPTLFFVGDVPALSDKMAGLGLRCFHAGDDWRSEVEGFLKNHFEPMG